MQIFRLCSKVAKICAFIPFRDWTTTSLNVGLNGLERNHSKVPSEAPGIATPINGGRDSVEGC